eukprot:GHVT01012164.1.p3 GENE.GHVT01012164.1~~GHVT01012164.1.p3  ORF type:complete len:107 (+),score=10.18 GHVT01012164.1:1814-2134(+)
MKAIAQMVMLPQWIRRLNLKLNSDLSQTNIADNLKENPPMEDFLANVFGIEIKNYEMSLSELEEKMKTIFQNKKEDTFQKLSDPSTFQGGPMFEEGQRTSVTSISR